MATLTYIRQALADRRLSIVAAKTGLHVNTLADIRDGRNTNPKIKTLEVIANYLIGDGE